MLSIGRVTRLWFYNKKGEPQPSVNIALNPWSTGTSLRVRRLLTRLSDPSMGEYIHHCIQIRRSFYGVLAREDEATDVVIASRKMAEWLNGNEIVSYVLVLISDSNFNIYRKGLQLSRMLRCKKRLQG